ncbi:MAG TPA: CHAT domain-containing tetratricopeptide repeat protein [Candidatus Angelobacter sp.]|nr:CHAT domain-containing tetratricopeptide repeat protein [Candidatus Angelobacter sp.]
MSVKHVIDEKVLDRLAVLPDDASRVKFFSRHSRLLSSAFVAQLVEAVRTLTKVDLKKACALADAAVVLAGQLGDKESRAFALRAKANALWSLGQNKPASELHTQSIQLFEEIGKPVEAARTLSISIQPLILLGEYERAHAAAARARKFFTAAQDTVRLARLEINVGNILHRQDRFIEALDCYERAYSQLLPDKDAEGIIAALHNSAMCLVMLNEYERAEETYKRVAGLCREQKLPLALVQAEYNTAYLHYLRGAYGQAIENLRTARETAQAAGDPYYFGLCQLDLSEIYLELNTNQGAAELAKEAFTSFKQLGLGYESAKALCNSAIALSQQGEGFRALEIFAQARDLFVQEKNHVWPSLIDLYRAVVYFNEGRFPESRQYCLGALEFFRSSPLPGRAILCRLLLARLSLKTGEIETARQECQTALESLSGKEMPILAFQAHLVMGQVEEASHSLQEAQRHYRIAKEVLEALRGEVHGEELKISFVKNRLEVYENLVELCLASGSRDAQREAWTYMEAAKSRGLLELIVQRMNPVATGDLEEGGVPSKLRHLREQLNWYYHRIEVEQLGAVPVSDERLLALREIAKQREGELLRAVRELSPAEAQAAGVEPAAPVSLDSVCQELGPKTTLLEYFRVQDRILAAIVTEGGAEIVTVTLAPRIAQVLRMLQFQFSKFRLGADYLREFHGPLLEATRSHLKELYTELLGPIRAKLKGQRLIVVPHELLHYVPFHALFDGERYLIDTFTISYAPSASIHVQHRRKQTNKTGNSLILGVPDRQAPSIYEELQAVAEIAPQAKVFLGPKATENVLKEQGAHSRLIHIATHGFFRQDNPMFSGIRLGESFLTLYDLYRLKLPAELITLSGCSTGLNVIAAGDELIGLVRGLFSAGAQSLLLTLWDVNDSSTAYFMKAFYSRLFNRSDRALALREAMVELKERNPHPYYWAPFILVG